MVTNRRTNNPIAKVYGDETRTLMTETTPAGRGDATRPDPAVIERAAEVAMPPEMARARDYMPDRDALKAADRAADEAIDLLFHDGWINAESLRRAIRAAAEVIIPATAEAKDLLYTAWTIIANVNEGNWDDALPKWREAAIRWRDRFHAYLDAAALSADATGGDGDE